MVRAKAKMKQAYKEFKWTWVSAIVLGVILSIPLSNNIERWFFAFYDSVNPVVNYKSEIISREDNAILIHVWGEKLRDCQAVSGSHQSYTIRNGVYHDAFEERVVGSPSSRPVGKVDLGVWRVWPTKAGTHVVMTINHRCDGRLITSEIARVAL